MVCSVRISVRFEELLEVSIGAVIIIADKQDHKSKKLALLNV